MEQEQRIVTVGPRAYSFHDQSTGITVIRGQKKALSMRQYTSKKIQRALATGHLVLVANQVIPSISETEVNHMVKKIKAQYKQGMELAKVKKGYNFEQAKALAKAFDIEADPEDTVDTLIEAIYSELSNTKE